MYSGSKYSGNINSTTLGANSQEIINVQVSYNNYLSTLTSLPDDIVTLTVKGNNFGSSGIITSFGLTGVK
jgi:hypothetical protein